MLHGGKKLQLFFGSSTVYDRYTNKNSKTEITKLIPINILYDDQWFFVDGTDSLSWMYKDNYDYIGMVEEYGNVCVYELTEDFILSLRRLEK